MTTVAGNGGSDTKSCKAIELKPGQIKSGVTVTNKVNSSKFLIKLVGSKFWTDRIFLYLYWSFINIFKTVRILPYSLVQKALCSTLKMARPKRNCCANVVLLVNANGKTRKTRKSTN